MDSTYPVYIRTILNDNIKIDVKAGWVICKLMQQIQSKTDILSSEQHLIFAGRELDPTRTIRDYDIQREATIFLIKSSSSSSSSSSVVTFPNKTERDDDICKFFSKITSDQFVNQSDVKKYECPICFELLASLIPGMLTTCGHNLCYICCKKIEVSTKKCPMCNYPLSNSSSFIVDLKLYREMCTVDVKCVKNCGLVGKPFDIHKHQSKTCLGEFNKFITPESGIIVKNDRDGWVSVKRTVNIRLPDLTTVQVPLQITLIGKEQELLSPFVLEAQVKQYFMSHNEEYNMRWILILFREDVSDVSFFTIAPLYDIYLRDDRGDERKSYVRSLSGRVISVRTAWNDRVLDLKLMIEEKEEIPFNQVRLIYNGRSLDDQKTLDDCKFIEGSTCHLVLRMRGD